MDWGKNSNVKSHSKHDRFESVVRPHINALYQTAYRFCGNQADAEDLIQDLLLKLYPKYDEMLKIENLKSWMSRVLYHLYIDTIRQNDRRPDISAEIDPDTVLDELNTNGSSPEIELSNLLIQKDIYSAMQNLNANQKALVVLHDIEEYTLPELSKMLETPVGTLKSRLHRARASLRETLQKRPYKMEPFAKIKRVIK
ncbi:MAG: RNA polymerase sigma factor [Gammaproteobacteria bacterium]